MFFSKLKISAKLIISSAVFLIPIGVMLFFICSITIERIQKSMDQQDGINTLKPAVTVMRNLPAYLNVYLGLEQGDLRILDEQISAAVRDLDRELERYRTAGRDLPDFSASWEMLRRTSTDDAELFQRYFYFANSINTTIIRIGEFSRLSLVDDMTAYYFVSLALTIIPEASARLISTGNLLRENLHNAETVVYNWNTELAEAQALGRRLMVSPFAGTPQDVAVIMLGPAVFQLVWNAYPLFNSDRDRIRGSLESLMAAGHGMQANEFGELSFRLEHYQETFPVLSEQYLRLFGFGIPNPTTAAELLQSVSLLNTYLCNLWDETFIRLGLQVQSNTQAAQRQLLMYLSIVLVSLGIALSFVLLITLDINRSVTTLKALFKGLNENDLTLSLQINSRDEFGELMTAFNGFLNVLRSTFGSFKKKCPAGCRFGV